MKNITDLTVTQIRIFPVDVVPISVITARSCAEKVRDALSISEFGVRPSIYGRETFVFYKGELRGENRLIIIRKIEVDPRRIIVEIKGRSKDGNEVYEAFLSTVAEAANVDLEDLRKPLLVAETTQCVATLDFVFSALFNDAFVKFLSEKVEKKADSNLAKASVRPLATAAEITYEITEKTLIDNKISMNPKQFNIAPRPGAPQDDRKYVISSPFDSDTHLKLIAELNKAITGLEIKKGNT